MGEEIRVVHFSIDDVGSVFREISIRNYQSIAEVPFFNFLQKLHNQYGLVCSLFIYEPASLFEAVMKCPWLQNFLTNSSDWIVLGFHGNKVPFKKDYEYTSEWFLVDYLCNMMHMRKARAVRLHNWFASDEQKAFLKKNGIDTLFYPDDNCFRYDDNDVFFQDGLLHRRTNVRIEDLQKVDEDSLFIGKKQSIVVFTHEVYIDTKRNEIEKVISIYYHAGYIFI